MDYYQELECVLSHSSVEARDHAGNRWPRPAREEQPSAYCQYEAQTLCFRRGETTLSASRKRGEGWLPSAGVTNHNPREVYAESGTR